MMRTVQIFVKRPYGGFERIKNARVTISPQGEIMAAHLYDTRSAIDFHNIGTVSPDVHAEYEAAVKEQAKRARRAQVVESLPTTDLPDSRSASDDANG